MIKSNDSHYDFFLDNFPKDTAMSVGWGSREKQLLCFHKLFEVFQKIPPINNESPVTILDVGCGLGHFYEYLKTQKRFKFEYFGIDISQRMIDECKDKFPEIKDNFSLMNIVNEQRSFDYVIACGAFNLRNSFKKHYYLGEMVKSMVDRSRLGVSFNLLSKESETDIPELFYYSLEDVFKRLSFFYKSICLDNTYLKDDFAVYIKNV